MRNALLLLAAGLLLSMLGAELALRAMPVSTGYDFGPVNAREPILRGSPRFRYTSSRGWNFRLENSGTLNNYGFRSSYDYLPDPRALVVIGNSFVQADALEPRETLAEQLGGLLRVPTYGVGADGFSLADYLAAARWSKAEFSPQAVLILLTTGDLDHSCTRRLGEHYLKFSQGAISLELVERATPSLGKRLLNSSSLFRYVFDNLRAATNWAKGWRRNDDSARAATATATARATPTAATTAAPEIAAEGIGCADLAFRDAAARYVLDSLGELRASGGVRAIFLLAPGYRREQGFSAGATRDVDWFAGRAASEGYEVVRLEPAFAAALQGGARLDFMPIDGHWNAAANRLAAGVAARALAA